MPTEVVDVAVVVAGDGDGGVERESSLVVKFARSLAVLNMSDYGVLKTRGSYARKMVGR